MMKPAEPRLETPSAAPARLTLKTTALFLDLDGTLAPIEQTPSAVGPDAARTQTLRRLGAAMGGRLAVLSGREISEIDRILEGAAPAAAGMHGLERRTAAGRLFAATPHPGLEDATLAFAALVKADRRLLLEPKGASIALHYRASPESGPAVVDCARRLAAQTGLLLQEGRMVAELRTPGPDKGAALEAFMNETPFAGAVPLMIGDDLTDEHAFAAANRLGGAAVLVGRPRPSHARWRLDSPAHLLSWLEEQLPATRSALAEAHA